MNMKKLFFLLFLGLVFNGCNANKNLDVKEQNIKVIKVEKEYFTAGGLRSEFLITDEKAKNGIFKKYGFDGKITSKVSIQKGLKEGIEIWYGKNGEEIIHKPYKNGKQDGIEKVFYDTGDVMISTPYKDGKKNGLAKAFDKNGNVVKEAMFVDGKIEKDQYIKNEVETDNEELDLSENAYNSKSEKNKEILTDFIIN